MELTVGNKTSLSAFFVVDSSSTYNALLDRDLDPFELVCSILIGTIVDFMEWRQDRNSDGIQDVVLNKLSCDRDQVL